MLVGTVIFTPSSMPSLYANDGPPADGVASNECFIQSELDDVERWAVMVAVGSKERDANEVQSLMEVLMDHGWKERNILLLLEEEATKESISTPG